MRRLAVAFALVAAVLAPVLSRADLALACSLAHIAPDDRIERFSAGSEAIMVGEVVEEREEPAPGSTPQYASRVRVVAVLAGDPPAEVRLAGLGQMGADCSGGPRLVEGERVLLFLTQRDALGRATGEWRVTGFQGKSASTRARHTCSPPAPTAYRRVRLGSCSRRSPRSTPPTPPRSTVPSRLPSELPGSEMMEARRSP